MRAYNLGKTAILAVFAALLLVSGPASASVIDQMIDGLSGAVFYKISLFGTPVELIVIWMAAPMLFLTVYFGFINLRSFKLAGRILKGQYRDDNAPGEVTQFQALSTALSGTVGLGNIAGVAIAIAMGGPGAAFWMTVIGFFAMTLKFAECTLGVKYRKHHEDGTVSGGPMYYLGRGLAARGWKKIGFVLAWSYALFAIPSLLQIAQVNQSYSQFSAVTGIDAPWLFGIVLAGLVAVVIVGGISKIASVTVKLVPLMAALYIGAALFIILSNAAQIPDAFALIIREAWKPEAGIGAIIGAFVWGMRRAVYSTEAGLGSATIAHAAAKTREPVSEGMVALLEPFIDTVVISSMTALVIVVTGAWQVEGLTDIQMTSWAFNSVIDGFDIVLAVAVVLFAYSTIISWGYYSSKIWAFVFGSSTTSNTLFKVVYVVALIPGGVFTVSQVFDIMDSFFFLMAVPNIIGIYLMAGELKRDIKSYHARLKSGEIKRADQMVESPAR
ncbi:alanine glycine permease [Iodidimonas muriae]|uniref:Alanine glycine permease n=1 Tax=Iodidimonas muriae TaxID=261467 RepID=A0ABQ2LEY3_9PROT|nr:alanine/glycine:cation symporter family protein [Iodidimonas muriae]GER07254.1 alanine glycine permease [Kordiimonadales bacterium JCM 17843]GGO11283.1 alanine glycine permease [Iodidimonas muriae]